MEKLPQIKGESNDAASSENSVATETLQTAESTNGVRSSDERLRSIIENFRTTNSYGATERSNIEMYNCRVILEEVRTEIETHQITCVLGDDKSARMGALIVGKSINGIYESKGEEKVPILFIDPGAFRIEQKYHRHEKDSGDKKTAMIEKVRTLFQKANVKKGTVLLVTDFISSGITVNIFETMLKEIGFNMRFVENRDWFEDKRSGLKDSDPLERDYIHAEPLFVQAKTEEDADETLAEIFYQLEHGGKAYYMKEIKGFTLEQKNELIRLIREEYFVKPRLEVKAKVEKLVELFNKKAKPF